MTLSIILFLTAVSLIASAAALPGEAGLRRLGLPTRWVWAAAMAAGPVLLGTAALPALAARLPGSGSPLLPAVIVDLGGLAVGGGSGGVPPWFPLLEAAAPWLWGAASLSVVVFLLRGSRTLRRERGTWRPHTLQGHPVLVSPDRGPAVAGFLHAWIVLPEWSLSLPAEELRMVLIHEEEHLRAGDSRLLAVGLALAGMMPWNPLAWWQLRRLRTAMEVDCDARVLARSPDRHAYGTALLSVAAHLTELPLALPAFSESARALQTRILAMTRTTTPWTYPSAALLLALAALAGAQACGVDNPIVDPEATETSAPTPDASVVTAKDVSSGPTFTPFTVAPSVLNRDEVVAALNAEYPPLLRDAGVGGRVRVYFLIDENGMVQDRRIDTTSGHQALDDAALRVARAYRFSPAKDSEGVPVPVWVSFAITFQVK